LKYLLAGCGLLSVVVVVVVVDEGASALGVELEVLSSGLAVGVDLGMSVLISFKNESRSSFELG
jgi:hypothetical protein